MPTIRKKMITSIFLGLFLVIWTQGMSIILPPEVFLWDVAIAKLTGSDSTAIYQVRIIKQNAVLRIKPKSDAVAIKTLPLGALLEVNEELDDWLKITLPPDEDGFVLIGYLHRSLIEKASILHE